MGKVWLIIVVLFPVAEWVAYFAFPNMDSWQLLLGAKYLLCCLMAQCIVSLVSKEELRIRSIAAFNTLLLWADFTDYISSQCFSDWHNVTIITACCTTPWLIWIIWRDYNKRNDQIDINTISLLFLRPMKITDVMKAFFGLPAASLCIYAGGHIWCFSHSRKCFVQRKFNSRWAINHCIINTGIKYTEDIELSLQALVGKPRGIGVKCVWVVRKVLAQIGREWKPKTWFHLIPGIYLFQVHKKGGEDV